MGKYNVKFTREFDVEVEAESTPLAEALANQVIAQFPAGTCKLVSIYINGYQEPAKREEEPVASLAPEARRVVERNTGLASRVRDLTDEEPLQA